MPRTVSIGGLTYDLFVDVDQVIAKETDGQYVLQLPLGQKIHVRKVTGTCGGGAANTSVGLRRLGCDAACCGVIGNDQWGGELLRTLRREGVNAESIVIVEGESSSFSIIMIARTGERVILNEPGTNAHLHDVTFDREAAACADWVYVNRLHEESCEIGNDIIAMLSAAHPMHLTWNPGGCQVEEGLRAKSNALLAQQTHLLLLNREEALAFTASRTVEDALTRMIHAGVAIACITDGPNGATASNGHSCHHCPALPCSVMDMTGAGDAFGTGMTWALLRGKDLPTALRAGTINASSVVGTVGAQAGLLTETAMQSGIAATELPITSLSH